MKKILIPIFAIIAAGILVAALDFNPNGNINMRSLWSMNNATNATFNSNVWIGGIAVKQWLYNQSDGSYNSSYAVTTATNTWTANQSFNANKSWTSGSGSMYWDGGKLVIRVS